MFFIFIKKQLKDYILLVYILQYYYYARKMYTTAAERNGLKWNIPEILRLQREWELLELSVGEIADLHGRTMRSIMFKLEDEQFATYEEIQNRLIPLNMNNLTITDSDSDTCQKKKHVLPTKMTLRSHVAK